MEEWRKKVQEHREKHGCTYKEALQHCSSKKQSGTGLNQTIQTVKVLMGFDQLQPIARKTLQGHGDEMIKSIVVVREDIRTLPMDSILSILSAKGYDYFKQQYGYDKLKHLHMVITTDKGTSIINEKNERIEIYLGKIKAGGEAMNVNVSKAISVNQFIQNAQKTMGARFFPYHPSQNNCQFYVRDSLKANGMLTPALTAFIMQPVDEVLTKLNPKLVPFIKGVTDLGKIKDVLIKGGCKCTQKGGSERDALTFRGRLDDFIYGQVHQYHRTNNVTNEDDLNRMKMYIIRMLNSNFRDLRSGLDLSNAEIQRESQLAMETVNSLTTHLPRRPPRPVVKTPKPTRTP